MPRSKCTTWRAPIALTILVLALTGCHGGPVQQVRDPGSSALERARVFLAAGDFRRALESCQEEVRQRPSAASYVYLTYMYHAIGGFLDHQAKQDRWVLVEQLVRNLSGDRPETLIDPPDVLARIAKEVIGESVQRESDVTAAMAGRLDETLTATLWTQQTYWRRAHPDDWWHGVPPEWRW